MESYKTFYNSLFVWNRNMLKSLGHDIYDQNFKAGWPTFCLSGLLLAVIYCICHTFLNYDGFTKLSCIFYIAVSIQVSALILFLFIMF